MTARRTLISLVITALTLSAVALTGAPAQAAGATNIRIWGSSHCLDSDVDNAARLQMWSCDGGSDEKWLTEFWGSGMYRFINQRTGWCVTAPSGLGEGPITLSVCDAFGSTRAVQLWRVYTTRPGDPSVAVWQSTQSGLCMTTPSVANHTIPRTTACDPSDHYDWWQRQ
ncbi:RICIN domain-containing protein [Streptomyces scabiei]|uniref:RICIN domain-containing protein n=1 Tax=Streptomyces scabiei TaxID=1930 RepID=UPI0029A98D8C|nr:RICIN domain-containing protein [Streptomyces scabiei]MDX3113301.1 ricin-type beta-trefoil lectin domain protein [Streptomyces scabiei]